MVFKYRVGVSTVYLGYRYIINIRLASLRVNEPICLPYLLSNRVGVCRNV